MSRVPEKRRLAALMFADIEGYTAMMQKDERAALTLLNRFKEVIQSQVTLHNGAIVQFYGDGCFCTFTTGIAALKAAEKIQLIFKESPHVPVRIGVNMGDVVVRDNNLFGNSVNLTSRIESVATAGAVLFSKRIKEAIKHRTDFRIQPLGKFQLKNVAESIPIYALANKGINIPTRQDILNNPNGKTEKVTVDYQYGQLTKWLLLLLIVMASWLGFNQWQKVTKANALALANKTVAVLIFENKTQQEDWNAFGTMASDWITQGFMETGASSVISAANVRKNTDDSELNKAAIGNYVKENGAGVLVEGRYYLNGDKLSINANIINALTNEIYHAVEPITGHKDEAMQLLEQTKQAIIGYWAVKDKQWLNRNPPKYDAYETYVNYLQTWGKNRKKTEKTLLKAYQQDTTFFQPLLKLAVLYTNHRKYQQADSIIQVIKGLNPPFTTYERLRFQAIEASFEGNYQKAATLYESTLKQFKIHGDNAGSNYLWANQPTKAIATFESYLDTKNLKDCYVCQWDLARLLEANNSLSNYQRVIELVEPIQSQIVDAEIILHYINAYSRMGNYDKAESIINQFKNKDLSYNGVYSPPLLRYSWMIDLYIHQKDSLAKIQAEKFINTIKNQTNLALYGIFYYNAAIVLGDYELAAQQAIEWDKKLNSNGVKTTISWIYLKMGDSQRAQPWIDKLKKSNSSYDRGLLDYNNAKLASVRGNQIEAMTLLKSAFNKGLKFSRTNYNGNLLLRDMQGFPAYDAFIKPR